MKITIDSGAVDALKAALVNCPLPLTRIAAGAGVARASLYVILDDRGANLTLGTAIKLMRFLGEQAQRDKSMP